MTTAMSTRVANQLPTYFVARKCGVVVDGQARGWVDEAAASRKRLSIHVEKHNPARRLYERLGFAESSHRGPYVLMEAAP
jgi:hypothetical protein